MLLSNEENHIIWGFHTASIIFGFILNLIGLYAIKLYRKKTNQNIILGFISFVEISNCGCALILLITEIIKQFIIPDIVWKICWIFCWAAGVLWVESMYILSTDRLVCVLNPLKYKVIMTHKLIKLQFLVASTIAAILGTIVFIINIDQRRYFVYFSFLLNIVYIVFAFATYIIAVFAIRRSKQLFGKSDRKRKKVIKKLFFVPMVMMTTFIICFAVPLVMIYRQMITSRYDYALRLYRLATSIGCVIDPIIYVLLSKHYRKALLAKVNVFLFFSVEDSHSSSETQTAL